MNSTLRGVCLPMIFCLFGAIAGNSQAQFNFKAGVEAWSIKDEIHLDEKSHHSGQTIGFDLHLLDNRFVFAPGFHYHRLSALNKKEGMPFRFGDQNHINYFNIPMTVGYRALDLKAVDVTALAGGEIFFFYNLEPNEIGLDNDQLHGVFTALTGVIHVAVFNFLTFEVKYHYALNPIIMERPDSKLRGFSLEAGIKF